MLSKERHQTATGPKRFRRRYPKAVAAVLGTVFFQVPMKAGEGAALGAEQEALLAEYEKIVANARKKAAGSGKLSPLETWREAVKEAEELVSAVNRDRPGRARPRRT